ncbi:thioredoxin family protein [Enterococcus faecalis]|nr:thioredoxin family protein [Enterococcus faecalis]
MKQTTNLSEVQDICNNHPIAIVYLSMPNCSVCHAVRPRLEELLTHYDIPALHLDAFETPEVASRFGIDCAPVVLVFIMEKISAARFIDFKKIRHLLDELTAEDDSLS